MSRFKYQKRALEQQVSESGAMKVSGLGLVPPLLMEAAETVPVEGVHAATVFPAAATRAEKGLMTFCTQQCTPSIYRGGLFTAVDTHLRAACEYCTTGKRTYA